MSTYQYPFRGKFRITCRFGKKGSWAAGWHIGNDMVGDDNPTIYPICAGTVQSINGHGKAYGNHIGIKHDDGMVSLYAHLKSISVKVGQKVTLNTPLGIMGATGNANGAHLHLELHKGAWKYPAKGSSPETATWLIDAVSWIEDHVREGEKMIEAKDLTVSVKGELVTVKAVNVDGSNYVLLRDVPKLMPVISVGYDAEKGLPRIE